MVMMIGPARAAELVAEDLTISRDGGNREQSRMPRY